MKKTLLYLMLLCITLVQFDAKAQAPTTYWADNAVTTWYNASANTFTLTTASQLAGLAVLVEGGNTFSGKTINIASDLNLGAHLWKPIGKNTTLTFAGTVNGNNYVLSNLYIANLPTNAFGGLFGQVTGAKIKNIKLVDATVIGVDSIGAIAGGLMSFATVENCHSTNGTVTATGANIGGLVGSLLTNSTISKSSAEGTVEGFQQVGGIVGSPYDLANVTECYAAGNVTGFIHVGGIAGYSAFAFGANRIITINNCYSRANVTATDSFAGGIYGGSTAQLVIKNSYSTGLITAPIGAGGLIGQMSNVTATNNYWDLDTSNASVAVGEWMGAPMTVDITGKTTSDMKNAAMVALLNQNQPALPWSINGSANDGYPILASSSLNNNAFVATKSTVLVYPTMTTGMVTISSSATILNVDIYSISGSLISSKTLNNSEDTIDLSGIAAGIYLLNIKSENGNTTHKIIKK